MIRIALLLLFLLSTGTAVQAAVEIQLAGDEAPSVIRSVYLREGTLFLPLREVLPPLHLVGVWDGAKRLYWISAEPEAILLVPGSRRLRYGKHSLSLKQAPRFFAGELCIPEEVVTTHLPNLLKLKITYVNQGDLLPAGKEAAANEAGIDSATAVPLEQVVIDAGHGGDDPGSISPDGVKEKDLNLALALRLEKILKMDGVTPLLLTRDGDYATAQKRRCATPRGPAEDNLLLSLHASAWRSSETHGCTLYLLPGATVNSEEGNDFILAQLLSAALRDAGVASCEIERTPLIPLSGTPFPAVLLELGYLTNPEELLLLNSPSGQERIANALATGVKKYAAKRQRRNIDVPVTQ